MENRIFFKQFAFITMLTTLLISCDTSEKDWNKAKLANSKTTYQEFIKKHSSSIFAESAQKAVDSLEWVAVLKTHNVDSLELFIKNHASSKFLSTTIAMDSLEWGIAYYSKDTSKLSSYIKKYPNSNNIQKAEDIIWEINWPPVKVEKANSLKLFIQGDSYSCGTEIYDQGSDGVIRYFGGMSPEIYIWRDFSKGVYEPTEEIMKHARKLGLRPNVAYLHEKDNTFKVIRKVDLNKNIKQLCEEFGVSDK
jgi:hypothetical protein